MLEIVKDGTILGIMRHASKFINEKKTTKIMITFNQYILFMYKKNRF